MPFITEPVCLRRLSRDGSGVNPKLLIPRGLYHKPSAINGLAIHRSGRAPAARNASCRSHADNSSPALFAASVSARFCSAVTRIRTTSSLSPLDARFLGVFAIE